MRTGILTGIAVAVVSMMAASPANAANAAEEPKALTIARVTPTGEDVSATRQIVLEFNRPVVPVGRMERTADEVGIKIDPPLNCQWRWLNTTSLSCNLDEKDAMKPATRYKLAVEPKIEAADGGKLAAAAEYSFLTERPDVTYPSFKTWKGPTLPVIRLVFNQPVSKSSVESHLYIQSEADSGRVKIVASPDQDDQQLPDYMWAPTEKIWVKIGGEARKSDDRKTEVNGEEARRVWLVEPETALASDQSNRLKIEKGLVSAEGPEVGGANRDVVKFDTFPDLEFAGVQCYSNTDDEVLVKSGQVQGMLCNPMRSVLLAFTAPVLRSQVKENAAFTPDLAGGRKDYNPWGDENRDSTYLGFTHTKGRLYYVTLPYGLKAAQTYNVKLSGDDTSMMAKLKTMVGSKAAPVLEDQFGRRLVKPVDMTFATNHRNPNFEMPYHDAVLEKNTDSDLPLYVNNLDSYKFNYRKVTSTEEKELQIHKQDVAKVKDVQYGVPMGVREMLNGKSGAIFGQLGTSPEVPNKWEGEYRLFAQVTPWQAHLKFGHFSSLIWVTDLATGQPVKDVRVTVYKDSFAKLSQPKDTVATAVTDENGIALFPGSEALDPRHEFSERGNDKDTQLFVRMDKDDDMALLPLSYNFSLNTWNFTDDGTSSSNEDRYGHLKSWGMTAQGIYRTGDTIQYKIFLRNQNDRTLTTPPKGSYTLEIVDPMGKTVQKIDDVVFSEYGAYAAEYKVPERGSVGWYSFNLTAKFPEAGMKEEDIPQVNLAPLQVLVADFTPSPFKVETEIGAKKFHPDDTMNIESRATLHSGGPYGDAAVRTTVTLRKGYFTPEQPKLNGFIFGASEDGAESEQIFQVSSMLDDKGTRVENYILPQQSIYFGKLDVESAVQDDRGKSIASLATADYVGVDRFVGLKSPDWFYESKKPMSFQTVVVDENGTELAGTKISLKMEREEISVAKVKGAGNAYQSDITREWKEVKNWDLTSAAAISDIAYTPDKAGSYRVTATIADSKGRAHITQMSFWVSGEDYVQWNDQDNLELPIVPEKKSYKIGETAKFLIKNPYPGATALVTVERYGVIDHFLKKLDSSAPVLEIPVKPDYMPGFYLSVVVVSPRVDGPVPALGQIDMGKPSFRMGYVTIPVSDPYKEMKVDVRVAREVYRPRETVKVNIAATPLNPPEKKEPVELAVAVLDESVFDLIGAGRSAYDPYQGFYGLDSLDVSNYSLLYRLIGKQKFDKKGANPGGDGGADIDMRTQFKYVSYWNPSVKTDPEGKAQIEFDAPDNLTGWRVFAVATSPTDRLGLGEGEFKVNRPTELRPVMPNQVREDDNFTAGFSVMNRTDKPRSIKVSITASGDVAGGTQTKEETVQLEPYKRATINLPVKAALLSIDRAEPQGQIRFKATAEDMEDADGTEFTLPILKKRVFDVGATYGTSTEPKVEERLAFPNDIYTDVGDVSVVLSPSVIANLTGAFQYMRDYPYPCWEQLLTQGVMAAHYNELKPYISASFEWKNSADLPKSMLANAANFQAPNGGMAYFIPTDERADPYLSAYTALAFHWLKQDGYKIPNDVETKLQEYLKNFLRQDAVPDFYQPGMTSTVRATALAALALEGKITSSDVKRYQPHVKDMSLFGKAQFLSAATLFDDTKDAAKDTANMIFSSGNETGGKFMFSETLDDGYSRILATPLRDNCAILSSFMAYGQKGGAELIGDKPFKLVRMITQSRGSRDHWENTQENMFCMAALVDYAKQYEREKPDMTVRAALDGKDFGKASFRDFKDEPEKLIKPIEADDPGKNRSLTLTREGAGRYYYAAQMRYAPKTGWQNSVNAGMDIRREYSVRRNGTWVLLTDKMGVSRGENVRVDLYLSIPSARNFVVVNDPVPGGLETVNRDLKTASSVDDAAAEYDQAGGSVWFTYNDWVEFGTSFWSFYHRELRHDSARFYADWLPAGNYHLSYMTQAIADGVFAAPPVRAEEMYDADVYGRGDDASLTITSP